MKTFANGLSEKKFVIEANLRRRHLNDFQKTELGLPLEEINKELAKQRQLSKLKKGNKLPFSSNELNGERGKARDIVARTLGLSPKIKDALATMRLTDEHAYQLLKYPHSVQEKRQIRVP